MVLYKFERSSIVLGTAFPFLIPDAVIVASPDLAVGTIILDLLKGVGTIYNVIRRIIELIGAGLKEAKLHLIGMPFFLQTNADTQCFVYIIHNLIVNTPNEVF
jgi:hypothetical protein